MKLKFSSATTVRRATAAAKPFSGKDADIVLGVVAYNSLTVQWIYIGALCHNPEIVCLFRLKVPVKMLVTPPLALLWRRVLLAALAATTE